MAIEVAGRPSAKFDVRCWLAARIGCNPDDLQLTDQRVRSDDGGAFDASYACGSGYAGRVLIGRPKAVSETEGPRRVVVAVWTDGSAQTQIGPDTQIVW
jgi:hypothetical protein